jgi:acetyl-CoA acetyltransferase family protein
MDRPAGPHDIRHQTSGPNRSVADVPEAVIVATARTAVGTARKGSLIDVDAYDLGILTVGEVARRSGIAPELFDDVILGESLYGGGDIARYAAIEAGLVNAPGVAQNRHCATGLAAISSAAASIIAGMDRVVIAGGTNSSSTSPSSKRRVPGTDDVADWYAPSHRNTPEAPNYDMSITVGHNAAKVAGLTREDMDAWALRSHQRAVAAIDAGAFKEEIFGVEVTRRDGTTFTFDTDEHPRRDTSLERLAKLKVLHPEIEGFGVTAGNASGMNDGAAAVVVTSREFAEANGLEVLAVVRGWASVGVAPVETGLAPIKAIPKVLDRTGLSIGDITLWEINEAFASVPAAACKVLGIDDALVNTQGSGCSLGHPIATTGARQVISLTHELRRRGGGTAISAMCAGGGMASALVLEVPAP